jgi:hypothetical protein
MPIRLVDKRPVGETPTGATGTVALPGTLKMSAKRIGMVITNSKSKNTQEYKRSASGDIADS